MAWIGAAIAAGGALLSNQQKANQAESMSHEQMRFSREMRASAYPATVQSMKDAGLNPMLAYSQGALPNQPMTPIQPNFENIGAAGVGGYQQAASAGEAVARTKNIEQEMQSFEQRMKKLGYETTYAWWHARAERHRAGVLNNEDLEADRYYTARAKKMMMEAELAGLAVPEGIANAAMWASEFGKTLPYAKEGAGVASSAARAFTNFTPARNFTPRR